MKEKKSHLSTFIVLSTLFILVITILFFFLRNPRAFDEFDLTTAILPVLLTIVTIVAISERYLRSIPEAPTKDFDRLIEEVERLKKIENLYNESLQEIDNGEPDYDVLKQLNDHYKLEVARYQEIISNLNHKRRQYSSLFDTKDTINLEIKRLIKNGNLNLFYGFVFAILGILNAFYNFFQIPSFDSSYSFFYYYIPKISITLLLEILGFFFLKLYKNSLDNIRKYNGEQQYVDSRISAITLAMDLNDKELTKIIIGELLKPKEETILKSGETTVEIEKFKLDNENPFNKQISELLSFLKKDRSEKQ